MPFSLLLLEFGEHVYRSFGHIAYHVGSSLREKSTWRDVDVRLMLPDGEYEIYGNPKNPHSNKRWVSTILAWSSFGKHFTGLPIDFQIQQTTLANEQEGGKPRSALFRLCDMQEAGPACKYCGCVNCDCATSPKGIFDHIEGLLPVDPAALSAFEAEMNGRVIPEIVATMRRRAVAAAESRYKLLNAEKGG